MKTERQQIIYMVNLNNIILDEIRVGAGRCKIIINEKGFENNSYSHTIVEIDKKNISTKGMVLSDLKEVELETDDNTIIRGTISSNYILFDVMDIFDTETEVSGFFVFKPYPEFRNLLLSKTDK